MRNNGGIQTQGQVQAVTSTEEHIPEVVFATPTYLLNGRSWSLGNPSPQQVADMLDAFVKSTKKVIATNINLN